MAPKVRLAFTSWVRHLPAILGVVLLIGAIYVVQREFHHLRLKDIGAALSAIPARALVFSFVSTIVSYFILTFYDRLGTIYAGHKVSYGRVAFASFCAYALSHNIGFSAVSGAAVRYRLYAHWGLTPLQIGKTVAFCSLTFALGGMVLGGAILFMEPRAIPFFGQHLPKLAMYGVGVLLWAVVLGYVTLSRVLKRVRILGHEIQLPGWRMAIIQVLLATVDVATTATIFYALLPPAPGLTWLVFLGVYVACYTAGLAANLPGGIGVFDTAMLFGLEPYVSAPHIIGAILVFRLYYYVIPLFLAGSLFAGNEILLRGSGLLRHFARLAPVQAIGRWSEPDFAVTAATGAVGLCGVLMLCLGVLAPQTDFSWIDPDYGAIASQAGQFVPSLIGAGLVMMAIALSHRVNLAWDSHDPVAGDGGGVRGDAGQPALGIRHPRVDDHAARAIPGLLLSPRPTHERSVATRQRSHPGSARFVPVLAGHDPSANTFAAKQRVLGSDHLAGAAELRPAGGGHFCLAGPDRDLAAVAPGTRTLLAVGQPRAPTRARLGRRVRSRRRWRRPRRIRPGRHPVPPLRARIVGPGRSGGRRNRPRFNDLAAARSGTPGGAGCSGVACGSRFAAYLWRPRPDRASTGFGWTAAA